MGGAGSAGADWACHRAGMQSQTRILVQRPGERPNYESAVLSWSDRGSRTHPGGGRLLPLPGVPAEAAGGAVAENAEPSWLCKVCSGNPGKQRNEMISLECPDPHFP